MIRQDPATAPDPSAADAQLAAAEKLLAAGNAKESASIFLQILAQTPDDARATYLLGVSRFRLQQFADAEASFRRSLELDNASHLAHYYLGLALERQGRLDQAMNQYRFSLTLNPSFDKALEKTRGAAQIAAQRPPIQGSQQVAPPPSGGIPAHLLDAGELLRERGRRITSFGLHFAVALIALPVIVLSAGAVIDARSPGDRQAATAIFLLATFVWILLFARAKTTKYRIYARRVDIRNGLLWRNERSVWAWEIVDPQLHRSPINVLTRDAKLELITSNEPHKKRGPMIIGFGAYAEMKNLWEALRDDSVRVRGEIKRWWL